jgi:hypothetical protein
MITILSNCDTCDLTVALIHGSAIGNWIEEQRLEICTSASLIRLDPTQIYYLARFLSYNVACDHERNSIHDQARKKSPQPDEEKLASSGKATPRTHLVNRGEGWAATRSVQERGAQESN